MARMNVLGGIFGPFRDSSVVKLPGAGQHRKTPAGNMGRHCPGTTCRPSLKQGGHQGSFSSEIKNNIKGAPPLRIHLR